jgi:C-terminal processing protease CtpA/Prc
MKYPTLRLLVLLSMSWFTLTASAQEPANESSAESAAKAAYEQALVDAEREREAAQRAIEEARQELERAATVREKSEVERTAAREQAREAERAQREEVEAMRRELSRVQEELRRASREVVRAHRQLDPIHALAPSSASVAPGSRAVIGVILGDSTAEGVEVLGVSPGGPAEKAGLKPGDVIVSVMGQPLAEDADNKAGEVLLDVMETVKAGDELDITVRRDDGQIEQTFGVVAEEREPFGWTSMIRLPSAPASPGEPVIIEEIIEVPRIDQQALAEKMEKLQHELEQRRIIIAGSGEHEVHVAPEVWDFTFQSLSELGEDAVYSANVWFGMPLTRGLELAEINEGLGEYFKADNGVLVLSATEDNALQLHSGDVVLTVAGKPVEKPADLMRELRALEPGATLEMEIMRKRKSRTLEIVVPERTSDFGFAPDVENTFEYRVEVQTN